MKQLLIIFFAGLVLAGNAQAPYTGGNGSGHVAAGTPPVACPLFFGGTGDGYAWNVSPSTVCPPFFGGSGDGYSAATDNYCLVVLPVRNIIFTAEKEPTRHLLHWTLEGYLPAQINVERSISGSSYTNIGLVTGNADPSYRYQFIDSDPHRGVNFYRLRITERDGIVTYSRVLVLSNSSASFISLYPNPARGSATLYYKAVQNSTTRLQIWQYDGRLVRTQLLQLARGANFISLDLQGLAAGLYIISVNNERVRVVVE